MQVENATIEDCSVIPLPRRNSWIVVIVTAIVSPTRFYVQLPLGCKSPLSMDTEPDKGTIENIGAEFSIITSNICRNGF